MAHDIVMEALDLRSEPVVEEGDTAVIVFEALENDVYFCSIPGHRQMMNGRLEIVESFDQVVTDEGFSPRKDGRPLHLGFERARLQDWKATGNDFTAKSADRKSVVSGKSVSIRLELGGSRKKKK